MDDLLESWINGNRGSVARKLETMSRSKVALFGAMLEHEFGSESVDMLFNLMQEMEEREAERKS